MLNNSGYIDLHTHGIGEHDTKTTDPDDILKMALLHGRFGTRAILPTVYPAAIKEMRSNMEAVKRAMKNQKSEDDPDSAAIIGLHLEGPFLNPLRCGALDRDYFLKPSLSSLKRLIEGYEEIIKIITIAPEVSGALKVIERCRELGIKVHMGHSEATYKEALEGKKAGATGVTHIFNAMRPFHHRDPGIVGYALLDEDLYIEVIADGIHLSHEVLKLIFKIKRNDRIMIVSDSIKGSGGKRRRFSRRGILSGGSMAISEAVNTLRQIDVPKFMISRALIENPARYLELKWDVSN